MSEATAVRINRSDLGKASGNFPVRELPVVSIWPSGPRDIAAMSNNHDGCIAMMLCRDTLRWWQHEGHVILSTKEIVAETAAETYGITAEEATRILDVWVEREFFRMEGEWLVPLGPMLGCAADHAVEQGVAWPCLVSGHRDAEIMFTAE